MNLLKAINIYDSFLNILQVLRINYSKVYNLFKKIDCYFIGLINIQKYSLL